MQRSLMWSLVKRHKKKSQIRASEQLIRFVTDLESVASAIKGSDLNITEDDFVSTAKCIQDNKELQLVTRSGLQRLRYCVCHLQHEQAMKTPYSVRQFLKTLLQKVQHYKVDVIAGDANSAAYKYYKKQEYQDL